MPKRKWRVVGPTSYGEAKEARGNLEYRKDMAEAQESKKRADSTIKSMETLTGVGKALMLHDKMKRQQNFKKRKNQL